MCLIIVYSRVVPGAPLVIAANRDELKTRPALSMDVLRERDPRILGGRDLLAQGTWLAVNEWGVVGALTNSPSTLGPTGSRDPKRRSRGLIPLRLTEHRTAKEAMANLQRTVRDGDYNACFVLVGDRQSLHYLAIAEGEHAQAVELPAGVHVLENRPLVSASPKADYVRARVPQAGDQRLLHGLWSMLQSRTVPPDALSAPASRRPVETEAAFVDLGPYGTRWSGIVVVPDRTRPRFLFSEQPASGDTPRCANQGWTT